MDLMTLDGETGCKEQVSVPQRQFFVPRTRGLRTVGIPSPNYGLEHVSYSMDVPGYRFARIRPFPGRLARPNSFLYTSPFLLGVGFDLVHTFNHIPASAHPFVVSFEREIPRLFGSIPDWQKERALDMLESSRCRAILALSEIAAGNARRDFEAAGRHEAAKKVSVFRGRVEPTLSSEKEKTDGPLRFLFVGGDGIRKGLLPTLRALTKTHNAGGDIRLTVVSSLPAQTYVTGERVHDVVSLKAEMSSADWVSYEAFAGPVRVREMMRTHDVFVMPTLDDSLGWTFIEAALDGCPAIGTSIYAVPELIDDGKTGRVIPLPLDENGLWTGMTATGPEQLRQWDDANARIEAAIFEFATWAMDNRKALVQMGQSARKKHMALYPGTIATAALKTIYDAA